MTDTSIRITSDTRDRLRGAKRGGETYSETINRLLDELEHEGKI
jgi:predicted CopG family antitoxin